MEKLATRLAEHGERMCAADCTDFTAHFPGHWPLDRPDVAVRRNVLLIGLEALHNAVRHAAARTVSLSLMPVGRRDWELTISDDGAGLPAAATQSARGRGLRSMRRRAAEIGAQLTIVAARPSGTVVSLRFATQPRSAAHRMIMRVRRMR
jgi:signal transduction histidine kinase